MFHGISSSSSSSPLRRARSRATVGGSDTDFPEEKGGEIPPPSIIQGASNGSFPRSYFKGHNKRHVKAYGTDIFP